MSMADVYAFSCFNIAPLYLLKQNDKTLLSTALALQATWGPFTLSISDGVSDSDAKTS